MSAAGTTVGVDCGKIDVVKLAAKSAITTGQRTLLPMSATASKSKRSLPAPPVIVSAAGTDENVVAGTAAQDVVAGTAVKRIGHGSAYDGVGECVAGTADGGGVLERRDLSTVVNETSERVMLDVIVSMPALSLTMSAPSRAHRCRCRPAHFAVGGLELPLRAAINRPARCSLKQRSSVLRPSSGGARPSLCVDRAAESSWWG